MFGSVILDTVIGLTLVYLILSVSCTVINELLARFLRMRATTLAAGIRGLLTDPSGDGLAGAVYAHPLIKGFARRPDQPPSYIPSRTFALALIDSVARDSETGDWLPLDDAVARLGNEPLKNVLQLFLMRSGGDPEKLQKEIADWFDDATDRMSGWYKRKAQTITLIVASALTLLSNADTLVIAATLTRDADLRTALVRQARDLTERPSGPIRQAEDIDASQAPLQHELGQIGRVGLPLGWSGKFADGAAPTDPRDFPADWVGWINKVAGLFLTLLAVSLGAPFWFDTLNQVVNVRSNGKAPDGE